MHPVMSLDYVRSDSLLWPLATDLYLFNENLINYPAQLNHIHPIKTLGESFEVSSIRVWMMSFPIS